MNEANQAQVIALPDEELDRLAGKWTRDRALVIAGDTGSGRRGVVTELLRRRLGTSDVHHGRCYEDDEERYSVLRSMGLLGVGESGSPEFIANTLANRISAATIVLWRAEHADPATIRALVTLARLRQDIRFLATMDRTALAMRGKDPLPGVPLKVLTPLRTAEIAGVIERKYGVPPTPSCVGRLERLSAGSFRGVLWLTELAERNGGLSQTTGAVHIEVPRVDQVNQLPDWSFAPGLTDNRAAAIIAIARGLSIRAVDKLSLLAESGALERDGRVVERDGELRLDPPVLAIEIGARLGAVVRYAHLTAIFEALGDTSPSPEAAGALLDWCRVAGMPAPPVIIAPAILEYVRLGRNREALDLIADQPNLDAEVRAEGAFAAIATGDVETGIQLARSIGEDDPGPLESAWFAVTLGMLNDGASGMCASATAEYLAASKLPALSQEMLAAWRGLFIPGAEHERARIEPAPGAGDRRLTLQRMQAFEAARAWKNGRPVAAHTLTRDLESDDFATVDRTLLTYLRATSLLLVPDLKGATESLLADTDAFSEGVLSPLLFATVGIYSGDIASSNLTVRAAITRSQDGLPWVNSVSRGAAAIAHAMLNEHARAVTEFDLTLTSTPTTVIAAASHHVRAIAAGQMKPVRREEVRLSFRAAAQIADDLDLPGVGAVANYRLAYEASGEQRAELLRRIALLTTRSEPVDGAIGLFVDTAAALGSDQLRDMVDVFHRLQSSGMVQDAKLLALRMVRESPAEIPASTRRAVSRVARLSFSNVKGVQSILTDREREVASLVMHGLTDREIGERLGSSRRTVNIHVGRILKKLNLNGRHTLTAELALRHGIEVPKDMSH